MRIEISTRHGHLGTESRDRIGEKVEKLRRFHTKVSSVEVIVDLKDEKEPNVEICASVEGAANFVAHSHGSSLIGAVESSVQKLESQLRRHKEKLVEHHRDPAARQSVATTELSASDDDAEDASDN